jgi:uncharacterized DUF497 family protein
MALGGILARHNLTSYAGITMAEHFVYKEKRGILFSWSIVKDTKNRQAHKDANGESISLEDGTEAYVRDPDPFPRPDLGHPDRGQFIALFPERGLFLTVFVEARKTPDGEFDSMRIISVRVATRTERLLYERERTDPKGRLRRKGRRHGSMSPSRHKRPLTFMQFVARYPPGRGQRIPPRRPPFTHLSGPGMEFHRRVKERGWYLHRAASKKTPGERLAALRRVWKWSQSELARRSGVGQPTISRLEINQEPLGARRAARLAKALVIEPAWILWGAK